MVKYLHSFTECPTCGQFLTLLEMLTESEQREHELEQREHELEQQIEILETKLSGGENETTSDCAHYSLGNVYEYKHMQFLTAGHRTICICDVRCIYLLIGYFHSCV